MGHPAFLDRFRHIPQVLLRFSRLGLRQFPQFWQEPQKVRILGGRHRQHRQGIRLPVRQLVAQPGPCQ